MDRFNKTHPVFQFLYFGFVFILTLAVYNPVFSAVSFLCAILYGVVLRGREAVSGLKFLLAMIFFVSIFNMLFAHYGESVLFSVGNTEFTLEALFYGFNQGIVLCSAILWFASFSRVVNSEKVVYVFRFMPKTALIFSMVLSFIPRFSKKLEDIRTAKAGLNGGKKVKGFRNKMQSGIDDFSTLISYSLESGIITSNSMQARGYNPKAVLPGRYKIRPYDVFLIVTSVCMFSYILYAKINDRILFVFEPEIYMQSFDFIALICFLILCLLPVMIDAVEEILWKLSSVKN